VSDERGEIFSKYSFDRPYLVDEFQGRAILLVKLLASPFGSSPVDFLSMNLQGVFLSCAYLVACCMSKIS
jgi:hypothetical protein